MDRKTEIFLDRLEIQEAVKNLKARDRLLEAEFKALVAQEMNDGGTDPDRGRS